MLTLGISIPLALLSTANEVIEWLDFPVEWGYPFLARLRHADFIEQRPLSGVARTTIAQTEFF
jgi:hypothetical protein